MMITKLDEYKINEIVEKIYGYRTFFAGVLTYSDFNLDALKKHFLRKELSTKINQLDNYSYETKSTTREGNEVLIHIIKFIYNGKIEEIYQLYEKRR